MSEAASEIAPTGAPPAPVPHLGPLRKLVFGLGDHTVNLSLSALSLLFFYFLTDVAGLRPALASAVVWGARIVDAITDPLVGRYSDSRTWRSGRRRPFFLIGMLPFAVCFALVWRTPFASQGAMFAYYLAVYVALSLATTILSVPYLALLPEMARDYDERTSLNAFRAGCAVVGTIFAMGMRVLADAWGSDADAYAAAGALFGVWLLLPWLAVHRVSFERPGAPRRVSPPLREGLRQLRSHRNFVRLCALFIAARIAVDLAGASLAYYTASWLREEQMTFAFYILTLLVSSIAALPLWLRFATRFDKHRLFAFGAGWWALLLVPMFLFVGPGTPRAAVYALIALIGIGYCAADLMPWAMIGEVIDEDELATGQRREGVYNGVFTFLRKIGGATGVLLMGLAFELTGYVARQPEQPESALLAIRVAATLAPAFFLAVAIAIASRYALSREAHAQVRAALDGAARSASPDAGR